MRTILFYFGSLLLAGCTTAPMLRIKGSDTEVNVSVLLAEAFHRLHPDMMISVSGGGTGMGIAALINGMADVANASRPISAAERAWCEERGITLREVTFAQDALAIIVNASLPLDSLSIETTARLFSGAYKYWREVGVEADGRVNVYGRQSNSGTHTYFKEKLGIHFSPYAREMNGNAQIIEAVKADRHALGYVGAGYVARNGAMSSQGFRVVKIFAPNQLAASPLDHEAVLQGRYAFQRPLYQYVNEKSYALAKELLAFQQSPEGRQIIAANGYFPEL